VGDQNGARVNTIENALRSLRYYVAQHLLDYNEDFDIRLAIEEDAWERPAATVQSAGPAELQNTTRRVATSIRPFAVYIYPAIQADAKAAQLEASRVEDAVQRMFRVGGFGGHPARVPLYDWSDVADNEALGEADPLGYMFVSDSNVDHRPDPDDERLQTVIVNVRLNWRSAAEVPSEGAEIETVSIDRDVA
jgi:hypothetical protein